MEESKVKTVRQTAAEYLKSKGLKNPPLDSGIGGGGDVIPVRPSDMMEEWSNLNGKFRDKIIAVAQSHIAKLEARNKELEEALQSIVKAGDEYDCIRHLMMPKGWK